MDSPTAPDPRSRLLAAGFLEADSDGQPIFFHPGRPQRVVVPLHRRLESPTTFLDQCHDVGRRVRAERFGELVGHDNDHPVLGAAADLIGMFALIKRHTHRLSYHLVLLWLCDEAPDWVGSMLGGALLDLPKRCVLPAVWDGHHQLHLPQPTKPGKAVSACRDWLSDLLQD